MRRRLALAAALFLDLATPALAEGPAGSAELRTPALFGFNLILDTQRDSEEVGVGVFDRSSTLAGLEFSAADWRLSATAGSFTYAYTGVGEGSAAIAILALSRDIHDVAGGTLSLKLRHTRFYDTDGQTDITSARATWSFKF